MTDHAKCKTATCHPVLQIRGEMGPGDYFGAEPNFYKEVDLTDVNRNDCRIACMTCGLATPWQIKDVPGMPNAGVKYSEDRWADAIAVKDQKSAMIDALRAQFGDEAIEKHFKFSL